ncbi:MAG: LPS-assembly protein LptD [Verrucomicrobia bacterium]|nr:LPS-assembly protein LptD [Verrucomicrobiota bacterium]
MNFLRPLFYLLVLATFSLPAVDEPVPLRIRAKDPRGEVKFDPATGTVSFPQGVIVTHGETTLTANTVKANRNTGEVEAEGEVTIVSKDLVWKGDHVIYNFKTGESQAKNFKTGDEPFYIRGLGMGGDQSNKVYAAVATTITTDNYAEPSYKIRAKELFLVPDEYFEARHAVLYLGEVPVFYYPYYRKSLKRHPNNFVLEPGYRSRYGPYLLTTYNWYGSASLSGSVHFDLRQKRGIGFGPDFHYDAGKFGRGDLETYYVSDQGPAADFLGNPIPTNRQRVKFAHIVRPETNLTVKAIVNYQSDPFIIRDFFESEYRANVQPRTFVEMNRFWDNWMLDILVQPQVNDFFETVERLPDVKLNGLRQQIGETPLFYESESSLGYYQRKFASTSLAQPDFSAFRGDTYHQVLLPQTFFGWLNVTPRVGGRFTYYSEAHGVGATTDEEVRSVFNTGAEVSFKASRVLTDAENKFFDVRGLRHIVEPSINYVFVPRPNVRPQELPQFDYELQSFRLLPIDFPDYNAIDSIDSQNVLRFALRNKLQTKRGEGVENLVNWALYTDWRLDPRTNQNTFADLYSDLDFRPRSWMVLNSETRFNIEQASVREANHRLTLVPNNVWSLTLGHRYLDDNPLLGPPPNGHNLIYDSFYYRMNENWSWRMTHFFEARDGTMEEQSYSLYRDLRSWTAALTLRIRDVRNGPDDFTIGLTFSLKAFPRFGLGSDSTRPTYLLGH